MGVGWLGEWGLVGWVGGGWLVGWVGVERAAINVCFSWAMSSLLFPSSQF